MHPSGVAKSSTSIGSGKGWNVTSAGWQVTQCDPIWHVSSISGVATSVSELLYPCYFYLLCFALVLACRRVVCVGVCILNTRLNTRCTVRSHSTSCQCFNCCVRGIGRRCLRHVSTFNNSCTVDSQQPAIACSRIILRQVKAKFLVRELISETQTSCKLVCDQVRAISTCPDSSNLLEPSRRPVLSWSATRSLAHRRPAREHMH